MDLELLSVPFFPLFLSHLGLRRGVVSTEKKNRTLFGYALLELRALARVFSAYLVDGTHGGIGMREREDYLCSRRMICMSAMTTLW